MKRSVAAQLIEIARIESHIPFHGACVLIAGQGETAEELARLLENAGAVLQKAPYDIVFLLEQAENEALLPLLARNALIVDASPEKGGDWAFFDAKGDFRRIRVVSLLKR